MTLLQSRIVGVCYHMCMQPVYVVLGVALFFINILAVVMVGIDKQRSIHRSERFPEVYFFFLGSCFASAGVLAGMFLFRHKTQKMYFLVGISLLLLQQVLLVVLAYSIFVTPALIPV